MDAADSLVALPLTIGGSAGITLSSRQSWRSSISSMRTPIRLILSIRLLHRARDRVGQPRMIEFRDVLTRALALDDLAGMPTMVEYGGADDTTTAPAPIRLPRRSAPGRSPPRPR